MDITESITSRSPLVLIKVKRFRINNWEAIEKGFLTVSQKIYGCKIFLRRGPDKLRFICMKINKLKRIFQA